MTMHLLALAALLQAQEPDEGPLARAAVLARQLEAMEDPKLAEKLVTELHTLQAAPSTPAELRETIRLEAVIALRAGRDRRLKALDVRLSALENVAKLRELKAELQKRREAALKTLSDPKVYLPEAHPDFPKGDAANGQAAVDALILLKHAGSVQELWNAPAPLTEPVDPILRADAQRILDAAAKSLFLFGETEKEPAGFETLFHHLALKSLDLRSVALDAREAELYAYNRKIDRYNDMLADPDVGAPEKEHAAVINEYREMMGRRRLFLDARLCRSSKKHSAACDAVQKIWHAGTDGDPQTRARLESFPNPVAENVAIAFAHPADLWWRGWFRASDHHRNAVSESWTCMGYGYVGNVGTQTFSSHLAPKALR
jgi:uncharacterized protein YkwD